LLSWPGAATVRAAKSCMSYTSFAAQPGLKYHPNVAAILRNASGEILICERIDTKGAWQFPQGGIDPGETAEEAMRRELWEEISIRDGYTIAARKGPYRYLYPEGNTKRGYNGKEQDYFLLDYTGNPEAIDLETKHPEFRQYRWIAPGEFQLSWLPKMKQAVYRAVFEDFFGVKI
jgi:putative (di)nucleoside polyphosphate hydrolase